MATKRDKQFTIENLLIGDVAAEGKCVARYGEAVVFVEGQAAPGDVADVRVLRKKKNFWEATLLRIHTPSPLRATPACQHFGTCGGCKWQHLDYTAQLRYKQQQVVDSLVRIAKVAMPAVMPILAAPAPYFYRNKLEYTFSPNRWLTSAEVATRDADTSETDAGDAAPLERRALGFHIPRRFDKILDIQRCYLQPDPSNAIRDAVKAYALAHDLNFFDTVRLRGFLRTLTIRTTQLGEAMVVLSVGHDDPSALHGLLTHLRDAFPQIVSLQYVVNGKGNDTFHDLDVQLFHGLPYLTERMEDLQFRIGPKSFYQTNAAQAYQLYRVARDFAQLSPTDVVYDLYTGTGTIANFVARQAGRVVGLEYVPAAIEDARVNAQLNGITNAEFFAGDIKQLLTGDFLAAHGRPDVVITDPPRAGMEAPVVDLLMQAAPRRIVYVSCNPATQARDLALLDPHYALRGVQPVDMFPHTHHVENVVWLERRQG